MTFVINKVVQAGRISPYGVRLSYLASGKPTLEFVLQLEKAVGEKTYRVFVPVQVCRADSEAFAATLEAGDVLLGRGHALVATVV
jgi:hypothetical protein